jgi:hypothetical protein
MNVSSVLVVRPPVLHTGGTRRNMYDSATNGLMVAWTGCFDASVSMVG